MAAIAATPVPSLEARRRIESTIGAALTALAAGDRATAIRHLGRVEARDATAAHRSLIGRVLVAAGASAASLAWFDRALTLEPAHAEAALARASVLVELGRHDDAILAYDRAYAAGVRDPVACFNHGTLLKERAQLDAALAAFERALALRPAFPEALRAASAIHQMTGRVAEALGLLDGALELAPGDVDAWLARANLLRDGERLVEALATLDAALRSHPGHPRLLNNRAIVLHDLGHMVEALVSLNAALHADPAVAQAHHNRGNVLVRLCRHAEAVASFETAAALDPRHAEAPAGRGVALKFLGRFDEAAQSFETALARDPASIHARANRGELRLLLGDFAGGWPDYEFRFFTERQSKPRLTTAVPEWTGTPCPGAPIVVLADQGNGDTIQFARFLPKLKAAGARVTFLCPPRLQRLLQPLTRGIEVRSELDHEDFAYQIALSSMPGAFRTDLATLAASRPYLDAEPERVAQWAERVGGAGLTIGLCWRGNQNWQCDPHRSIPLAAFAPLAAVPGVRLVSLQMPDNAEANGAAVPLLDVGGELDTGADGFVDTAAVIANLDLVVTCDTSIAHLAGALGRPTWVLLQAVPEWRWMLERPDSPWYPTMRLFRQPRTGDWTSPIAAIVEALRSGPPVG